MLLLGHIGITLGTALVLNRILTPGLPAPSLQPSPNAENDTADGPPAGKTAPAYPLGITGIIFIMIGSMLPDTIDKPVGHFLFTGFFGNNGRLFSHTLLFALIILVMAVGLYVYNRKTWLLAVSFGVFMHLILDFMWRTPRTLFWPLFGLEFPRGDPESSWLLRMIYNLLNSPSAYISELVLLIGVVLFFVALIYSPRFAAWLHIRR